MIDDVKTNETSENLTIAVDATALDYEIAAASETTDEGYYTTLKGELQ